jgi:hypothetical protein
MRWVVVVVLVLLAVVLATRRMNPISRASAADAFGRRFMWLVLGWRVWRLVAAIAVVSVAVLLATSGDRSGGRAATSGGTPGRAPVPAATVPAAHPAPVSAPPATQPAASGGLPVWSIAAAIGAAVILVLIGVLARRGRSGRELDALLAEDDEGAWRPRYGDPWEQAGTWPTERADPDTGPAGTTEDGEHAQTREDRPDDLDAGPGVDEPGGEGSGTLPVEDLAGSRPGASVHDLTRRRRRPDRHGL